MKQLTSLFAIAILLCGFLTSSASAQDFGDHTSATLTTKAWNALNANDHDMVMAYTNRCIETYMKQAKEMQAQLSAPAPKDTAAKLWALNDVGTCLFIQGQSLLKKGDKAGALKAYKTLVDELSFAQCWDAKGWFWQPAGAAKQKVVELSVGDDF